MYSVRVTTRPDSEPVSLGVAKEHLRTYGDHEDVIIQNIYIPTARQYCEDRTNRQFMTATLELSLDGFPPGCQPIPVPRAPLRSVSSIVYQGSDGTETTMPTSDYIVDTRHEPGRIFPAAGKSWPATKHRNAAATVLVEFEAGYGEAWEVPHGLFSAMLLLIGHYYYHREAVVVGTISSELAMSVDALLEQYSYGDEFTDYGANL